MPDRELSCSAAWARTALAAIGIDLDAVRARIGSSFGPEALTQAVAGASPSGLKGGASALVLLRRAHPDIFADALRAVINKAKQRNAAAPANDLNAALLP